MAWVVNRTRRVVWNVFIDERQIVHIDMRGDQDRIAALDVSML